MKDATNFILTSMYGKLNNAVSYKGNTVKYYSLMQEPKDDDMIFINVASSYIIPTPGNKDFFIRTYAVGVDVVNVNYSQNLSEKAVNDIADRVGILLKPSPSTLGLSGNTSFYVVNIEIPDTRMFYNTVSGQYGSNNGQRIMYHVRKTLTIDFTIKQK